MLIRISGHYDGIKEYLEKGQKQNREFSRDEMDERVILAGELDRPGNDEHSAGDDSPDL
ncbi:hypothetical protein [Paraburkholderia caffeinilytica]|uniref:hypothetical protein n=1 Tax=Paraburkholderia caffeinilytica TaxID=1761016 RepID=UPI003DA15AB8